jgi:hippurate hydrolase
VASLVDHDLDSLVVYYKALHAAPELSRQEEHTAADLARELRGAGFEVTEHVGRYPAPGAKGTGVVALLRNGTGPTLLVRADMDALPVEEQTDLPYASHRRMKNEAGVDMPVMHACGHDVHVTALVGTARVLARLKSRWHGTLILLGQPAEETIDGALAVVRDGLYERFPRPDLVLALHDSPFLPAGSVGVTAGFAMATSTQMDVVVRGVGGHGSRPEDVKDPIVLAANIVMQLQTIVSREISPFDQAVVTVGTIHGGTKRNIIPNEVKLELNIRAYKAQVREHIVQAVARIARAAALGAGMPEDRLPLVSVIEGEFAPALYNEPATVARVRSAFERVLGAAQVHSVDPVMASEDFGYLGLDGKIPVMMFALGANSPERLDEAQRSGVPVHGLHTSRFEPIPAPTLHTGVVAMSTAILEILGN